MKPILRIVLLAAAVLLLLQAPGLAAPNYYIGADSKVALEQAREANPNNYAVNYFLGQIYLAEGNRDAAIDAWGAYLAAAPDDGRATAVRERMTLLKLAQAREFARKAAAGGGAAEAELPANTIAVTDFKNLGPARLVPFIKGLTAMIISDLAKVPQVRVLERAKIQALMQEMQLGLASGIVDADTAPKLGRMVQARKVAWGKMDAPDGSNLKITSIVTEIMENTNLQETDAQGAMTQFFELQKKLVFGILQGMGIDRADLPDNVRKAVEKVHTKSVDALIQFGMGVDLLDNKNFAQAKAAFAKATRIDPGFDLAGEAETATPISDVPVTSDGATEEVSMSTAGSGDTGDGDEDTTNEGTAEPGTTDEGTADSGTETTDEGTADEGTGDDTYLADTGDTTPSTAETVATDTTTVTDTTTDTSQTTTTEDTQTSSGGWPGIGFGVITLDYWFGTDPKAFVDAYRTTTPQSGSSTSITATAFNTPDTATVNGTNETITALSVNNGTVVNDSGLPYQMKSQVLGSDSYMEWGKFNAYDPASTPPMVEGSFNHSADTLGYYVGGDPTSLSQIATLASQIKSASYSGNAYGTIWTPTGGVDMNGDLTMDVDFHLGSISNFVWEVWEGGTASSFNGYAYISGGSGTFSPGVSDTYTVSTASAWAADPDGASNPAPADSGGPGTIPGDVRGTFYGTDAMKTGGIVILQGPNNKVIGNYEATRGALTP